jgi:hypothetical protein
VDDLPVDMTTKDDLKALLAKHPLPANHASIQELCLSLSVDQYWAKIAGDDATCSPAEFYASRGDQNFSITKWRPAETPDEKEFKPEKGVKLSVKQVRENKIEIQVKNNPFVKKVPSTISWFLIEKSNTKIQIRTLTKNSDVPFCDSFMIEMETLVLGFDKPN